MIGTDGRNLVDALCEEITRVRDTIMPQYLEIGSAGALALMMMRRASDRAIRALAEQDAPKCLASLGELRGFTG